MPSEPFCWLAAPNAGCVARWKLLMKKVPRLVANALHAANAVETDPLRVTGADDVMTGVIGASAVLPGAKKRLTDPIIRRNKPRPSQKTRANGIRPGVALQHGV